MTLDDFGATYVSHKTITAGIRDDNWQTVEGDQVQQCDVIVLGAGAAGMMSAMEAGKRGRRVLLLDHADKVGKKILISGGGRCNFTNLFAEPQNFLSANPHFAKSALARFTPADMVALVEKHGIAYHEKTLGQLFCDRSARDIVTLLEQECTDAGVTTQLETRVLSVERGTASSVRRFVIETSAGRVHADSVIVATGGLSIPKMGATGFGYQLAEQFGLKIVKTRPGLVPFTFAGEDAARWCDLAGVSAEVVASVPAADAARRKTGATFREKLLVTHRGLSGPAVLQISSYWTPGGAVNVDLAPDREVFEPLRGKHARRDALAVLTAVRTVLSGRWAERWVEEHLEAAAAEGGSLKDLTNASVALLEKRLHTWTIHPSGTEGYSKAEVTAGGVDTAELDARTMEANKVPGLYFIGEVVDVTGWLGGYNFQWAWASGYSAGVSA